MADDCDTLEYPHSFNAPSDEKISRLVDIPVTMGIQEIEDNRVAELLRGINLSTIEDLSLRSKHLTCLPESFTIYLKNLTSLDLSDNKLKSVPLSLKTLYKLEKLVIERNLIRYLPLTITELSCLRVLKLSGNYLTELPSDIADLRSLETLVLSDNELKELPVSCHKMRKIKKLDLSGNRFKFLPLCLVKGMEALEWLDLSKNSYINISVKPASQRLRELYLRESRHNLKFPLWILQGQAPSLKTLVLDDTSFELFDSPETRSSIAIKHLSVQRCNFHDDSLQKITSLTNELVRLKAGNGESQHGGNAFWSMPVENLRNPRLVNEIDLRCTGLPAISRKIGSFVNLVKLDVGRNNLNWLPDDFCLLKRLEVLVIDGNLLCALPDGMGLMTSLKELRASKNYIAQLPESLRLLRNLEYLDLYRNDFKNVPKTLSLIGSLVGLDIDKNLFDTKDLLIGETEYEKLRKSLWNRYEIVESERETGPRYERDIEEQSNSSSDDSSLDSCDWNANVKEETINTSEENWDISEDSADEWDPDTCTIDYSAKRPSIEFSYAMMMSRTFTFCPADLHAPRIKRQLAQLQEKGLFNDHSSEDVEGQFDDA